MITSFTSKKITYYVGIANFQKGYLSYAKELAEAMGGHSRQTAIDHTILRVLVKFKV